ncbi:CNH domain protein [Dictyocaulus viviparus]|uniref:CNH domain protein n=1 Tax=Dictyocaulus viviparus TaxID=29172 RepID=A0A0D8XWR5_DICVI|nr:CNH domain protein [Dictyocaulus viviparus]
MNGWVRIFSDDSSTREWHSAWGEMDEKQLVFYNNDATQSDLKSPFLMIDLEKELCIVRVVNEMPLKAEKGQMSHNIVHIRTENRNIYILAPSTQTAERWAEALQNASTRRMMLTRRPSSFAEQSCILVLSKPNNLTIHTTCVSEEFSIVTGYRCSQRFCICSVETDYLKVIDNCLLIGAQSGLFFTHVNTPRLPVRIGGFNSITAIECLQDINMLVFVIDHHRLLAFVPLLALKSELHVAQPYLRADVMPGYENIHMVAQHRQEKHWYLFAASSTKIYVLRYNMARDIFVAHQVMETNEPVVCIQSAPNGVYFGSDSFYFVQLGHTELEPIRVADPSIADYPIAVFPVGENEVILAYQNYGLFVNSHGKRTRSKVVEWEQMPMEFAYTAPYLYVIHYDSIEIMRIADYHGLDSSTILDEREVYECRNAHVVCCCPNGDVFISISNTESVEVHRFNATNCKKNTTKRKGYNLGGSDKRSKVDI